MGGACRRNGKGNGKGYRDRRGEEREPLARRPLALPDGRGRSGHGARFEAIDVNDLRVGIEREHLGGTLVGIEEVLAGTGLEPKPPQQQVAV